MEAPKPFEQAVDLTVQRFMDSNSFALPGSADELYDYASTKAPPKAADYCYARNIMNVININHVIMEKVINQQAKKTSKDELEIGRWLMAGSKAGWVRFYPYPRSYFLLFRCYSSGV